MTDSPGDMLQVQVILERLADSLCQLSAITDRLQHSTFHIARQMGPEHLATFQELDRLHQSLDNLSRFVRSMALVLPPEYLVGATAHVEHIKLARLCEAMLSGPAESASRNSVESGELDWLAEATDAG